MKGETLLTVVKEKHKLESIQSRTSYSSAWIAFFMITMYLALVLAYPEKIHSESFWLLPVIIYFVLILALLQSFFLIVRHLMNKRFIMIIEAILQENEKTENSKEKITD